MGKKNKIKDVEGATEPLAIAEQLDTENAPSVKRKSKKHLSTEIESTAATNGSPLEGIKKDKKKKSKALTPDHGKQGEDNEMESNAEDVKPKEKKKERSKEASAEEGEELISFKKPSKKRTVEPENLDTEIPPKVSKADDNMIMAGTTIDQIVGIKLKNKKGKREKKREKHALQIEEQKKKSKEKEREEIRQYLDCWSANREKWKFHKLRQIYIQDHVFDETEINADLWPVALEYLSGTKGSSRDMLVKKAGDIIREADAAAGGGDESLQASSKYERARELMQCFG
uniref:WKF domain-containing protein n=1 Tax=Anopheles culicifacies TaxID=139723 RepID=A0A182LRD3_9DIPT